MTPGRRCHINRNNQPNLTQHIFRFTDLISPESREDAPPLVPLEEGEVAGRAFGADLVGGFDHHTGVWPSLKMIRF